MARLICVLAGIAWATRSLLAFADPDYVRPVTAIDWAAVWTYSAAWLLLAPSVLLIARLSGSRAVTLVAAVSAVGAILAGVANALEDGFGVPIGPMPYILGFVVGWVSLFVLAVALARARQWKLGALCLAVFVGILLAFGYGGGVLIAVALAALAWAPHRFVIETARPLPHAPQAGA